MPCHLSYPGSIDGTGSNLSLEMEREVLGYVHIRKSSIKIGFFGILQPFSNAMQCVVVCDIVII